ncbi:unnamed protein product [Discula destructiva]
MTAEGSSAVSSRPVPKPTSNMRRKRDHGEMDIDTVTTSPTPASSPNKPTDIVDLTSDNPRPSRKQRRVGPSTTTIPRTLPMAPHDALLAELRGKYSLITATVISSSKINKKVSAVLAHLGHIDMFSADCVPGVMMLHARAGDTSKLVTIMELAKRRMSEVGHKWYQYNRVYEVAEEPGSKGKKNDDATSSGGGANGTETVVVEDTVLEGNEDEDDAFEPTKTLLDLTLQDKPATDSQNKNAYMSIFLSRVPMPELQAKPSFTLQTNESQLAKK